MPFLLSGRDSGELFVLYFILSINKIFVCSIIITKKLLKFHVKMFSLKTIFVLSFLVGQETIK